MHCGRSLCAACACRLDRCPLCRGTCPLVPNASLEQRVRALSGPEDLRAASQELSRALSTGPLCQFRYLLSSLRLRLLEARVDTAEAVQLLQHWAFSRNASPVPKQCEAPALRLADCHESQYILWRDGSVRMR